MFTTRRHNHPKALKFVGLAFMASGTLCLSLAAVFALRTLSFQRSALHAPGIVIELRHTGKGYAPVYAFTDNTATTRQVVSRVNSSPPAYSVGDKVDILYLPSDLSGAEPTGWMMWFAPLITGGIGAIHGILGACLFLAYLARGRR